MKFFLSFLHFSYDVHRVWYRNLVGWLVGLLVGWFSMGYMKVDTFNIFCLVMVKFGIRDGNVVLFEFCENWCRVHFSYWHK
jgi:hypothetical protein